MSEVDILEDLFIDEKDIVNEKYPLSLYEINRKTWRKLANLLRNYRNAIVELRNRIDKLESSHKSI